jgi:BREX system ATP-binding protein BrxC/D
MDDLSYEILAALRLGSVPATGLQQFAVGREKELAELERQLGYVAQGKSRVKFVSGEFGAGKSFFCALVREFAFSKGFAASTVVISPDSPLAKLDVVVGKTFDGLRLPEKRTACALSDLLEKWLFNLIKRVAALEGLNVSDPKVLPRLNSLVLAKIDEDLSSVNGLDASFANAIKAYMQAKVQHDHRLASDALGWLKGSSNLAVSRKHQLGVRGELSPLAALNFVKGLLYILQASGVKGLVWVIDEVETVQRLPNPRQRENSYESLRVLVDQVAENALPGLLLIVTGTPRLFEDPRYGVPSYQALKDRINQIEFPDGRQSVRQPLLTLPGFDFERLLQVGKKIREIHAHALSWRPEQRLTDEHLDRLAEMSVSAFGGHVERTPRIFLREVVHLCDMLHDHSNLSADEYFKNDAILTARLSAPGSRHTVPASSPPIGT